MCVYIYIYIYTYTLHVVFWLGAASAKRPSPRSALGGGGARAQF